MDSIKKNLFIWVAIFAAAVVCTAWGITYYLLNDHPERGTFGDMFGGLNALFSGFAFVGVIVAILMQSVELRLQREELSDTREVLDDQKEQLESQSRTLSKQNFENTFFQLVQYNDNVLSGIGTNALIGKSFLNAMLKGYSDSFVKQFGKDFSIDVGSASQFSEEYFERYAEMAGSYFETVLTIFRFIQNSNIEDKQFYVEILRAKMSIIEWKILFYHGLDRKSDLRIYLEQFNFFRDFKVEYLCNQTLFDHYDSSAYYR